MPRRENQPHQRTRKELLNLSSHHANVAVALTQEAEWLKWKAGGAYTSAVTLFTATLLMAESLNQFGISSAVCWVPGILGSIGLAIYGKRLHNKSRKTLHESFERDIRAASYEEKAKKGSKKWPSYPYNN